MITIGLILFAAAVAAAAILIVQNNDTMIYVHWLGRVWHVHEYWLLVAGLVIMAVGAIGLATMRVGTARYWRLRSEHRALMRSREEVAGDGAARAAPAHGAPAPAASTPTASTPTASTPTASTPTASPPAAGEQPTDAPARRGFGRRLVHR